MTSETHNYPPIADHELIGDLQTAALVSTDGTVDWFCCPRFDSPTVFASLVDRGRGGHCRIRPARFIGSAKQLYFPDTAVLITRFLTEDGIGELVDFMPPLPDEAPTGRHRLVRVVRCVRGTITFEVEVAPRFDYGRRVHRTHLTDNGAVFECGEQTLLLAVREPGDLRTTDVHVTKSQDVRASIMLEEAEVRGNVLESGGDGPPRPVGVTEIEQSFEDTVRVWHSWLARSTYHRRGARSCTGPPRRSS